MTTAPDPEKILKEFRKVVNMPPGALRRWLASDDSKAVGMTPEGERVTNVSQGESVGHHMGERILVLRQLPQTELKDDDYADMQKVVGYIHRHLAQRPSGDVSDSRWRKSLMNWGHDPLA